ncbi:FadR/GntR family transcriptional regulator [Streptomyces sp. KR80]|uniref:FadR/GntR family transcriptional regulator n=1 Tax=Streptomyces sp. KR80 TaxID=3457426 RepID=UPI003FD634E3
MGGYTRRGLHGQIVHELATRIISGQIAPGEVLDIPALEAELDISRTVLREAFKVLTAKGLVDARQKRGTFVRPREDWHLLDADMLRWRFTQQKNKIFLDELAEVRGIVEPATARLAAERRTETDLERLQEALAAMSAAADGDGDAVEADLAFHRALLAAAHNELLRQMEMILAVGLAERDRLVHAGSHATNPVPSHQAVLDAVRSGHPDAAEAAMRTLLDQARHDLDCLERSCEDGQAEGAEDDQGDEA